MFPTPTTRSPASSTCLTGALRRLRPGVECVDVECVGQWLHPEPPQQLEAFRAGLAGRIHHGAETARVVQPQHAQLVTRSKWSCAPAAGRRRPETQAAGHSQVQEQDALVQVEQQVFAAAPDPAHRTAHQELRFQAQRPAQGLAQAHGFDPCPRDAVGKTQACDFDFGKFWHRGELGLGLLWFDEEIPLRGQRHGAGPGPGGLCASPPEHPARGKRIARAAPAAPSPLDAELFYQLLLGELNARGPGAGCGVLADARCGAQDQRPGALRARRGTSRSSRARATRRSRRHGPGSRRIPRRARPTVTFSRSWSR